MRKTLRYVAMIGAIASMAAFSMPTSSTAKDLVYGSGIPSKSTVNSKGVMASLQDINKKWQGPDRWKFFGSGQVISLYNALDGVKDGLVDAGFVVPVFVRKQLKHVTVLSDMQAYGTDTAAVAAAATETMLFDCPECIQDYKNYNALHLASFANAPFNLMCRKKVETVADVKGLKVRAVGGGTRLAKRLGMVPVGMSPPDATTALQRGGIDCVHGAIGWLRNFGYGDVATHVLDYPMGSPRVLGIWVLNRNSWNKMSGANKKLLVDSMPMMLARIIMIGNYQTDREVVATYKKKGLKFTKGGPDFQKVWAEHVKNERGAIIGATKKLGVKDPGKIMDAFLKNLAKWEKISKGKVKGDLNAYAKALKEEIYDRVDPSKL